MENLGVVAIVVLGAVAVAAAIYLNYLAAKKRREALAAITRQMGWEFSPDDDYGHDEEYARFEIFRRGHSRFAFNTLAGALEVGQARWPAKAGDYQYKVTSGSGKHRRTTTYRFSYLIVHMPWAVPDLLIRRERILDKIAGAFGFEDIDFESEEFSRKFHVKSPDKRFAFDVCHPRMMEFLLDADPPAIDIERGRMCLSNGSSCWEPAKFREWIGFARQFFQRWPEHLTRRLEGR